LEATARKIRRQDVAAEDTDGEEDLAAGYGGPATEKRRR
jgi:hypothetical protein